MSSPSEDRWEDEDWEFVLNRIHSGDCLPFLGAGASAGTLPTGAVIAEKLAVKHQYPLQERSDLIKVSQYVALRFDRKYVKEEVLRILDESNKTSIGATQTPYKELALLPLPIYVTTNYDRLMYGAMKNARGAREEICRWNPRILNAVHANGEPTAANPMVFYLHGSKQDVESLVLTEDDYLDFLTAMVRNPNLLPPVLEKSIRESTVLFIGYRLADWNFRILFQQLATYNVNSIAVFPSPRTHDPSKEKIQQYLSKYYGALNVKVCWETAEAFMQELVVRYEKEFGKKALIGNT